MGLFDLFKPKKTESEEIKISPSGLPYIEKTVQGPLNYDQLVEDAIGNFMTMNHERALLQINKALDINNKDADAYHIRGSINHALGNTKDAYLDWKKCNELGGNATELINKHCKHISLNESDIIEKIAFISRSGINVLESNFRHLNNAGKLEIFMFNLLVCWIYVLTEKIIQRDDEKALHNLGKEIYIQSAKFGTNLQVQEAIELYQTRFKMFAKDISGIKNSDYPRTKQYLPTYTFSAIYYDQLNKEPNLEWANFDNDEELDIKRIEELSNFIQPFIQQYNWILKELNNKFCL